MDDRAIAAQVARQHGHVAAWQLRDADVSRDVVAARVGAGHWHRVHRGVYAVGHRRHDPHARYMAAVLAGGPGALLSHRSAAALWRVRPHGPGPVHVLTTRKLKPRKGVVFHWTRHLPPRDRRTRDGIPVTSLERTLADLARIATADELELATQAAERVHGYERTTPHHSMPRGDLERRFLALIDELGLPVPEMNLP